MGHVLKANQVRLEEPVRLSIGGMSATHHPGADATEAPARIRVTESNADFAVLEVTCSCGKVIQVHCEYAHAGAAPVPGGPVQP
jgi:hypothetical protein